LANPTPAREVEVRLKESIETKQKVLQSLVPVIAQAADLIIASLESGKKVLLCGNGGSAADSQHVAAELVGKLFVKRRALPAIALTTDTSNLTALANDFSYDAVFSRQLEALGQSGDVLIAISTSGNSPNVLEAVKTARAIGVRSIGLSGRGGGALHKAVDLSIVVPSENTQRIQESHLTIEHILCELIEARFAKP
jgi:D-sedoheptulose 7-phosphate isomerase